MRKLTAMALTLVFLLAYIILIVSFSGSISGWPRFAQLLFYIAAGTMWVIPLRPLMAWMNKKPPPEER